MHECRDRIVTGHELLLHDCLYPCPHPHPSWFYRRYAGLRMYAVVLAHPHPHPSPTLYRLCTCDCIIPFLYSSFGKKITWKFSLVNQPRDASWSFGVTRTKRSDYHSATQSPRSYGGRKRSITPDMLDALCEHLLEERGLHQPKMILFLLDQFNIPITTSNIERALWSRGRTFVE